MAEPFVHLNLHSEYSLVDSVVRIKPLVQRVAELGMPAVAMTDQCNLFGLVKFYKAAMAAGVKPIAGVDLWLRNPEDENRPDRLTLLVKDSQGYRNLTRLVSLGYRQGQHLGRPMLERAWIAGLNEGLILLSGGRLGDVGRAILAGNSGHAESLLDGWLRLFGDRYYLELSRTGREDEEAHLHGAVDLALAKGVPVVATNDVRFLDPAHFHAHEVRVCIHEGRVLDDPRRPRNYSEQQYLRSAEEMAALFADLPEALENSVEIAKRCNLELTLGKNFLPDFPIPKPFTVDEYFRHESRKGLEQRLNYGDTLLNTPDKDEVYLVKCHRNSQAYEERLELELDVIIKMGFPGYFLIVADFIQWARDNDVPVGPGRGSGAGSLVAYALKITDLDPIEHDLLFERFLNPERVSMPDFDIDFCMDKRDRVIDYVADRYGRDSVSQIITHGSMAAKAVVRDVGRVLGHPYGFVDKLAKLVPFDLKMTLDKALEESEELKQRYDKQEDVHELIDMARSLEGLTRNAGKHAGGVVIAPGDLTDFVPLYCEAGGEGLVSQYDKDDVEEVGLVKFDFLGLRNLTIIDWALKTINRKRAVQGEAPIDITRIPMDDPAVFELLKRAETTAIFQLESRGMKELIKKLQPDRFEDITALVALYRPGPLQSGMVDNFINRKHGREKISYPDAQYQHESLKPILEPTYGVILYQEQVMQIAQVLAGYSLGGADLLRRAMGKKKPEEMARQREGFQQGAADRGIDPELAMRIFDLVEKFAGYGFNKSHSAAYALVSYQTLWLKAHYPAAYMAAVLSSDMDNTDKVVTFIEECRQMRLRVEPPHVNHSDYMFTERDDRTILYGLGAIKGVGESAIEGVMASRRAGGPFADLFQFCKRIDLRKANRRVLEALIRAGALDELGPNRATLMLQLPLALKLAEQQHQSRSAGMGDLFGMDDLDQGMETPAQVMPEPSEEWEDEIRLQGEKETLGLYLTGHPVDRHRDELRQLGCASLGDLVSQENEGGGRRERRLVSVAGMVVSVRHGRTQRGPMASVVLDDRTGRVEATFFSEAYEAFRALLTPDRILIVTGQLVYDDYRGGWSLRAEQAQTIEQARALKASRLLLGIDQSWLRERKIAPKALAQQLRELLEPYRGEGCRMAVKLRAAEAEATLMLGESWRVMPGDELLLGLRRQFGEDVSLEYNRREGGPVRGQGREARAGGA
ncbi:MAG: DNA polymerase III subunit alpha [Gammaproteobacteria bacterium]|nr:DNA polymerase III subunit alpha [Gammaproteobacteria bacterium]MBU1656088.1 DNA polymerase III subunit alpha [Gammaproteobacteria bacterium]MBU1962173.1 DNA polymerase III subunit alpha [Gammaproteobacteria bacterium]